MKGIYMIFFKSSAGEINLIPVMVVIAVLVDGKCAVSRFNLNGGNEPGLLV